MPTPRLPASVLDARGAWKKNPNRTRTDAVDDRALGNPPEHFDETQRAAWLEIVANALPDTLSRADRIALEVTTKLLLKMRSGEATSGELSLLSNLLGKLGCTPADRSRVVAIPKPKKNDFADL